MRLLQPLQDYLLALKYGINCYYKLNLFVLFLLFTDGYKGDIALTADEYAREVTYYEDYQRNLKRKLEVQQAVDDGKNMTTSSTTTTDQNEQKYTQQLNKNERHHSSHKRKHGRRRHGEFVAISLVAPPIYNVFIQNKLGLPNVT